MTSEGIGPVIKSAEFVTADMEEQSFEKNVFTAPMSTGPYIN